MCRVLFFWLLAAAPAAAAIVDGRVFINELHYDNVGADRDQFVEVAVPTSRTDRSDIVLTLYNGGNSRVYGGPLSLDGFTMGDVLDEWTLYYLDVSLQNGSPDGLALVDDGQVVEFLSYEGTFVAANGVAVGLMSTNIGVFEPAATPRGWSLQLGGIGGPLSDFQWQLPLEHTRGGVNRNQSFRAEAAVPEPMSVLMWLGGILVLVGRKWLRMPWRTMRRPIQSAKA